MDERTTAGDRVFHALLQFVSDVAGYESLADLTRSLFSHLRELTPFDQLALVLHDPVSNTLRLALEEPPGQIEAAAFSVPMDRIPIDFGPAGWVWQSQQSRGFSLVGAQTHPTLEYLQQRGYRAVCFVPLTTPRTRLGTLGFGSRSVDQYHDESIQLMERTARLLALAIEHTGQVERLGTLASAIIVERDRAQLLLDITNAVASELQLADLLAVISRLLLERIPHHFASITLWDAAAGQLRRRALVFPAGQGVIQDGLLLGSDSAPPRIAFDRGETMTFRFAEIAQLDAHSARVMAAEGLRSVCCIPLQTARNRHGTLNVARPDEVPFAPDERQMLEQVAGQLAIAIENALHYEQAQQYRAEATAQRDRLRLLLDVNNAFLSRVGSGPLELTVLEAVRAAVPHDYASVAIFDPEARGLRLEAITTYDERGLTAPRTLLPIDGSPSGLAFTERKALLFDDFSQFPQSGILTLHAAGMRSICCVPLITPRGAIGTLNLASRHPGVCTPAQVELLVEVAGQVAIAVENALAFQQISNLTTRLNEEKLYLEDEITRRHDFTEIIGNSRALSAVLKQIRTVAPTDATVLLLGETGTGKELLARAIHALSRRQQRTFVRINGAALPSTLLESELFGYEKGAFTGAVAAKVGRLELADRGTLFLDEVGDLPLDVQPKLLRALQEREFERLGSTRTRQVDIRLVAATNRDLEQMVGAGTFRNDLFYRLNVFPIHVPPLRERRDDIPLLVQHFTRRFAAEMGRGITTIPASTMDALGREPWPGNIRELQNVIERAVILSPGTTLQIPASVLHRRPVADPSPVRSVAPATDFRTSERDSILHALRETRGIIGGPDGAASRLGLKRTTLHSKMRKLGIARPSF